MTTLTPPRPAADLQHDAAGPAPVHRQSALQQNEEPTTLSKADRDAQLQDARNAPKIAAAKAEKERVERQARREALAEERTDRAEEARLARAGRSAGRWRRAARWFAICCAVVSLPLQLLAFYTPVAPFMLVAPLILEGAAWALLTGAEAAVDDNRSSWHYRVGALLVACFAAYLNYTHGSRMFNPTVGTAGAFASLMGPLMWDMHEYGRIARRTGHVSRRQRRADERARRAEARKAEEQRKRQQAEREKARAEADSREKALDAARAELHREVWQRAVDLYAAIGETRVTERVWARAWVDVHGTVLGDTAESIAARVAATARAKDAATTPAGAGEPDPAGTLADGAKPHVESLMREPAPKRPPGAPDGRRNNGGRPPLRRPGDTPEYIPGAAKFNSGNRPTKKRVPRKQPGGRR